MLQSEVHGMADTRGFVESVKRLDMAEGVERRAFEGVVIESSRSTRRSLGAQLAAPTNWAKVPGMPSRKRRKTEESQSNSHHIESTGYGMVFKKPKASISTAASVAACPQKCRRQPLSELRQAHSPTRNASSGISVGKVSKTLTEVSSEYSCSMASEQD